MVSISSRAAKPAAMLRTPRRPAFIGTGNGEREAHWIGCCGKPEGYRDRGVRSRGRLGQCRAGAWNCLKNPRDGVSDQIRYLGLRVALLFFPVNARRQRNDEKFPAGYGKNGCTILGAKPGAGHTPRFCHNACAVPAACLNAPKLTHSLTAHGIDPPLCFP